MSTSGGSSAASGPAGGDLAGTYPNPSVAQINTSPLGTTTGATTHQALAWSGTAWVPGSALTTGTAGGDLSGTFPNPTVAQINGTALGTLSGAATNQVLGWNGSQWVPQTVSLTGGLAIYGDGSDGAFTFDGSTTILGVAPSTNTYTMNRDWFLGATTINNGVSIITAGFRLFVQGTLTNNGTIQWNGNNASGTNGATPGAALGGNNVIDNAAGNNPGLAGGSGGTGNGNNGNSFAVSYGVGGAGGNGGTGNATTAGTGGSIGGTVANRGGFKWLLATIAYMPSPSGLTGPTLLLGGAGGGSGGGDATNAGGAGGGGGGIVILCARAFAGTGSVTANGGAGGNVTTSSLGCGGGGGGGGGGVIVISSSVSGGAVAGQTITANGGLAGTHHGTTATDGHAGSNGTVVFLPN